MQKKKKVTGKWLQDKILTVTSAGTHSVKNKNNIFSHQRHNNWTFSLLLLVWVLVHFWCFRLRRDSPAGAIPMRSSMRAQITGSKSGGITLRALYIRSKLTQWQTKNIKPQAQININKRKLDFIRFSERWKMFCKKKNKKSNQNWMFYCLYFGFH